MAIKDFWKKKNRSEIHNDPGKEKAAQEVEEERVDTNDPKKRAGHRSDDEGLGHGKFEKIHQGYNMTPAQQRAELKRAEQAEKHIIPPHLGPESMRVDYGRRRPDARGVAGPISDIVQPEFIQFVTKVSANTIIQLTGGMTEIELRLVVPDNILASFGPHVQAVSVKIPERYNKRQDEAVKFVEEIIDGNSGEGDSH